MIEPEPPSLPGSPVVLRRLRHDEAPYPGALCAGEPPLIAVDDADLPEVIWRADADGHLLAPRDVARTAGGAVALLPVCRQRLGPHHATTPGQTVTLAVSILRAAREAGTLPESGGGWWVSADGRPVLALGGDSAWRQEAAGLLTSVALDTAGFLRALVTDIAEGVLDGTTVRRRGDEWEDALFTAAAPEPIVDDEAASSSPVDTAPMRAALLRRDLPEVAPETPTLFGRLVDVDIAHRATDALSAVWAGGRTLTGRMRPRVTTPAAADGGAHRRRGPVLVAVAVIGVIATLGVLWPESAPSSRVAGASAAPSPSAPVDGDGSPSPTAVAAPTEVPAAGGATADASDLERGAREALNALAACIAGDAQACRAIREDPGQALPDGLVAASHVTPSLAVLDEYGGVAVIRADAPGFASQAVVLVHEDEKWLVREVYDLADQP